MGVELFIRTRHGVELTIAGQQYFKSIKPYLLGLEKCTADVISHKGLGGTLKLGVVPTFATRWLLPKLHLLNQKHPERQSILVEVLNPKTAIFYIAFLPQFINTSLDFPVWSQFIILGLIVNLIFVSADVVCVFLANYISQKLTKSKKPQKSMSVMGGLIFMGLGVFLGFKNQ